MDKIHFEDKKSGKKVGMLIALSICIVAMALGFWSAISRTESLKSARQESCTEESTQSVEIVEKNKTDVEAEPQTEQPHTKAQTQAATVKPTADFFAMPVGGAIAKKFSDDGLQYSDTFGDWRIHLGLDIAAKTGTEVHAAGNGKVTKVYSDTSLGNVVVIDHGNGITAYYCGLNSSLVKEGQTVEAGKTIGGIGNIPSESVEETHLHFAVQKDGKWANPITALDIKQ